MPKWLRVWLIGFVVYLSIHWLGSMLFGLERHGPFHSLLAMALGAFLFGGFMSWFLTSGDRPKPPEDRNSGVDGPST